jgi:hypothetical protein
LSFTVDDDDDEDDDDDNAALPPIGPAKLSIDDILSERRTGSSVCADASAIS